eukprot:666307_1
MKNIFPSNYGLIPSLPNALAPARVPVYTRRINAGYHRLVHACKVLHIPTHLPTKKQTQSPSANPTQAQSTNHSTQTHDNNTIEIKEEEEEEEEEEEHVHDLPSRQH